MFILFDGSSLLQIISNFLHLPDSNNNLFCLEINDTPIFIPFFAVISCSSTIAVKFSNDSTLNKYKIDMNFRKIKNKERIISIFTTRMPLDGIINLDYDDVYDFAYFGSAFGNDAFIKPMKSLYKKLKNEGITTKNALFIIDAKVFTASITHEKINVDEETAFIARNFSFFCSDDSFREWSIDPNNEEFVELIIKNDNLHMKNEDDLLKFILSINNDSNRFVHLFDYVLLEYCSAEAAKMLSEYIETNDLLQSRHYRESILRCLQRNLAFNIYRDDLDISFMKKRYDSEFVDQVVSKNVAYLKNLIEDVDKKNGAICLQNDDLSEKNKILNQQISNINNIMETGIYENRCTFSNHGCNFIDGPFFACSTCRAPNDQAICPACAVKCHSGHTLVARYGRYYCDCGHGGVFKSECKIINK